MSFLGFCGMIGRSIVLKLGGYLFSVNKALPFVSLGIFNVSLLLLLLITMFLGIFGREAPSIDRVKRKRRGPKK